MFHATEFKGIFCGAGLPLLAVGLRLHTFLGHPLRCGWRRDQRWALPVVHGCSPGQLFFPLLFLVLLPWEWKLGLLLLLPVYSAGEASLGDFRQNQVYIKKNCQH